MEKAIRRSGARVGRMGRGLGPGTGTSGGDRTAACETADYIEYMADMIVELQRMADERGLVTLSGILGLAYTEARLSRERLR